MLNNVQLQKSNTVDVSNSNDSVEGGGSFEEIYKNEQQNSDSILDIDKLTEALEQREKEKSDKKKLDEKSEQKEQGVAGQNTMTLAQQKHILMQQQKNNALGQVKPKNTGVAAVGQKPVQKGDSLIKPGKTENIASKSLGSASQTKEPGLASQTKGMGLASQTKGTGLTSQAKETSKQNLPFAKTTEAPLQEPVAKLKTNAFSDLAKPEANRVFDSGKNERILKSAASERGSESHAAFMDHTTDNGVGQVSIVEQASGSYLNPQILHGAHASLTSGYQELYKNWANYYRVLMKKSSFFVVYDSGAVFLTEEKSKR